MVVNGKGRIFPNICGNLVLQEAVLQTLLAYCHIPRGPGTSARESQTRRKSKPGLSPPGQNCWSFILTSRHSCRNRKAAQPLCFQPLEFTVCFIFRHSVFKYTTLLYFHYKICDTCNSCSHFSGKKPEDLSNCLI